LAEKWQKNGGKMARKNWRENGGKLAGKNWREKIGGKKLAGKNWRENSNSLVFVVTPVDLEVVARFAVRDFALFFQLLLEFVVGLVALEPLLAVKL
jgi:hypothetical protein